MAIVILGARPSTAPSLDISIRDLSNVEVINPQKYIPVAASAPGPASPAINTPVSSISPSTTIALKTIAPKTMAPKAKVLSQPQTPQAQPQAETLTGPINIPLSHQPNPQFKPQPTKAFVDPAIISVGKPTSTRSGSEVDENLKLVKEGMSPLVSTGSTPGDAVNTPQSAQVLNSPSIAIEMSAIETGVAKMDLQQIKAQAIAKIPKTQTREARLARHRRKKEQQQQQQGQNSNCSGAGRGKGWRNTPLLENAKSFQPFTALKRNSKLAAGGGWASEDLTDKNEFDFAGGLAKFDKRTVFEEITKCDTIREDERLVYHNLKAKPGTAGGKNLHHSENVLDMSPSLKTHDDFWNSEADVHIEDRRSNKPTRKNDGRPGLSRQQSIRKPSIVPGLPQPAVSRSVQLKEHIVGFYLEPSNRYIDPVSPLQMITLENTAVNELGMPEVVLTENAGRGVAEVTLHTLQDPAVRHGLGVANPDHPMSDLIQKCVVLVLAGNNKSGARAIAAARQLRCKGVEVILCVVDLDRDSLLIDAVRHQVRLFRNFGGRVYDKQELFDLYRTAKENGSPITSTLIIDGLLGLTVPFEELRTGEQTTVYELIHWVSKDPGFVISLDIPSGVDPSTGRISIIDGLPLCVKPRYVVSFAAPKKCLAEAIYPTIEEDLALSATAETLRSTVTDGNEWRLFIVDIGLDTAVWKKAGIKARHAVDFSGEWTCKMHYRGLASESDEDE
ncbi:Enhancer of mRNA-decapping protein 3 [Ceratocystis lukuohia]|uniref:Enhancer of mRNA-decapping protein 3 n=1 Tax=Ceratocystis lukuohia TaxID=2019550 RepID=A0ABR4MDH5_9PEZI